MTDFKASDRDVSRAIRSWLHEDRHEDASRIAGAVLDRVEATPRRRANWWPVRRTPIMNRFITVGLGAAAVVVIGLLLGAQLLGEPTNFGGPSEPTATPEVTPTPQPTSTPQAGLPVGSQHELAAEIPLYVTVPAPGWESTESWVTKGDGLVITGWVGDPFIPTDPCHWASTMPDSPATTLDEIVDALGRQATRDASEPGDVTADGFSGKSITLHAPDEDFSGCDEGKFCTFGLEDGEQCHMWYQEPGMVDELWIVDRDGEFTFTSGAYYSDTSAETVDEVRAILASMTFSQ
jgi:hypothetical protein